MTDKPKDNKLELSQDLYEFNKKLNEAKTIQEMLGTIESFKFYLMTQLKPSGGSGGNWLAKLGDNIRSYVKS